MPTAMPDEPFTSRLGQQEGRTTRHIYPTVESYPESPAEDSLVWRRPVRRSGRISTTQCPRGFRFNGEEDPAGGARHAWTQVHVGRASTREKGKWAEIQFCGPDRCFFSFLFSNSFPFLVWIQIFCAQICIPIKYEVWTPNYVMDPLFKFIFLPLCSIFLLFWFFSNFQNQTCFNFGFQILIFQI